MIPISERQCASLYIQKAKKCETFIYIYKNSDTLQKARQFALHFYWQKSRHFTLRNFSWKFWNWHLYKYKKHATFPYVKFLYTKIQRLGKKQDNLRYIFLYTEILTLCVTRFFMEFLKLAEGGGGGFKKTMHFALNFYIKKTMYFPLRFYIQKSRHVVSHFYMQKKNALCVTF